jgi:hypothetical protein
MGMVLQSRQSVQPSSGLNSNSFKGSRELGFGIYDTWDIIAVPESRNTVLFMLEGPKSDKKPLLGHGTANPI